MDIRVAPTQTVPASVYRHLLPREDKVIAVRFHPAVLIGPAAVVLGGLAIARNNGTAMLVIWLVWAVLVLRLVVKFLNWFVDYFVITSKRLLSTTGLFTRTINMMPLTKVTDMRFERTATGRLLGYGKFIVESAGQEQALQTVNFLP